MNTVYYYIQLTLIAVEIQLLKFKNLKLPISINNYVYSIYQYCINNSEELDSKNELKSKISSLEKTYLEKSINFLEKTYPEKNSSSFKLNQSMHLNSTLVPLITNQNWSSLLDDNFPYRKYYIPPFKQMFNNLQKFILFSTKL